MSKKVEVYFDYVCPYCYTGLRMFKILRKEFPDIIPVFKSVEAHPKSEPAFDLTQFEGAWEKKVAKITDEIGLEFNPPVVNPVPRSEKAFEGMMYILDKGLPVENYHYHIFRKHFVEQQDISKIEVILEAAKESGADLEEMRQVLEAGKYTKAQEDALVHAYIDTKIEYIPTFISGQHRLDAVAAKGVTLDDLREFLKKVMED